MKLLPSLAVIMLAMLAFTPLHAGSATTPGSASVAAPEWITLGTLGGPIPNPRRSQPANAYVNGDTVFLVDAGDGAAERLAGAGIGLQPVRTIFLSHLHLDHTAGLAGVISLRWMTSGKGDVTIYGPKGTQAMVDGVLAFMEKPQEIGFGYTGAPPISDQQVRVVELEGGEILQVEGVQVTVAENSHFSFDEMAGEVPTKSFSYRFDTQERAIVYTGDTGPSTAVEMLAKDADLLVSEMIDIPSSLAIIRKNNPQIPEAVLETLRAHFAAHHVTPEQAGQMAARANVGALVLTHICAGDDLEENLDSYAAGAASAFSGPVNVASDLDRF